jgi:hypothetical protein
MTQSQIQQSLHELNQLVVSGELLGAFEKYYHDDVAMQENNQPPTITKDANRQRELEFLRNIREFRKAEVQAVAIGKDISTVIWTYDYTHEELGVRNYTQVSIQHWKDGKIIKEQFVYNN